MHNFPTEYLSYLITFNEVTFKYKKKTYVHYIVLYEYKVGITYRNAGYCTIYLDFLAQDIQKRAKKWH